MNEFIIGNVNDKFIARAKHIRAERDKRYGNIFQEKGSDLRWVGEIGELCFLGWAEKNTSLPVKWLTEDAAGKADFLIGEIPIGVKTVKRKGPPKAGYTAQITARHSNEPVEHYFFATYEYQRKRLYLLGGIARQDFLLEAKYHPAGDKVHGDYEIREGHEIYNIEIEKLTPPKRWLGSLQGKKGPDHLNRSATLEG